MCEELRAGLARLCIKLVESFGHESTSGKDVLTALLGSGVLRGCSDDLKAQLEAAADATAGT